MNNKFLTIKSFFTAVVAFVGNKFGFIFPTITLLIVLMITDYISGMFAAKKEAVEHPNDSAHS